MRIMATVLFIGGIPWALLAWMGLPAILAPLGYLDRYDSKFINVLWRQGAQSWIGYFVWFSWLWRARNKKLFISWRIMWGISTIHHMIWIWHFLIQGWDTGRTSGIGMEHTLLGYVTIVAICSLVCFFVDASKYTPTEQSDSLNPLSAALLEDE